MGNAADAFLRHTVHTAQVASIGHGDPDVVDRSAVSVYHRNKFPALSSRFCIEMYLSDLHPLVDRLAHIINGQKRHADTGQRLHLDAGLSFQLSRYKVP